MKQPILTSYGKAYLLMLAALLAFIYALSLVLLPPIEWTVDAFVMPFLCEAIEICV